MIWPFYNSNWFFRSTFFKTEHTHKHNIFFKEVDFITILFHFVGLMPYIWSRTTDWLWFLYNEFWRSFLLHLIFLARYLFILYLRVIWYCFLYWNIWSVLFIYWLNGSCAPYLIPIALANNWVKNYVSISYF